MTVPLHHREAVSRVIRTVRDRLDEPWTLTQMAQVAFLSRFHFSRVFRQVTGAPPGRFLSALRMAEARRLVVASRMNVTDICTTVGYSSLGTFTTQFTEQVGVGPGRLRRLGRAHGDRPVEQVIGERDQPAADGVVSGVVRAPRETDRMVLIGLFPTRLAQGRPASCATVRGGGEFRITGVPDGTYHLLACAHPEAVTVHDVLAGSGDPDAWVGAAPQPVVVRQGRAGGPVTVRLAPSRPTDPPILSGLPVLPMTTRPAGSPPRG
jgi:AraC-like DNA-binding protein